MSKSKKPDFRKRDENFLFFKQLIKTPRSLGAIAPSSRMLADFISKHVDRQEHEYVIEIGAGTGSLTRGLIESGIPRDKIIVVELDGVLVDYLQKRFPDLLIIQGDASGLAALLPTEVIGNVRTVISGIPMVNIPLQIQRCIVESCFVVMVPEGKLLQFTYTAISPLSVRKLKLHKKLLGHIFLNLPPATVWSYSRSRKDNPPSELKLTFKKFFFWRDENKEIPHEIQSPFS